MKLPADFTQRIVATFAPHSARLLERRIAILSESLGLDRQRIHGWAIAQAVLSAWWTYADEGGGGETSLAVASALATLRP